jgi:hypothetical protein
MTTFKFPVTVTVKSGQTYPHREIRLLSEEYMCWSTNTINEREVVYTFLEESYALEFAEVVRGMFDFRGK